MRASVKALIWYLTTHHDLPTPVVDIGARQAPNQLQAADLRQFFRHKEYIGCDTEMGLGVDRIENVERLTFPDNFAGTLLCLDTLEHVRNPVQAASELRRVTQGDGILVVTSHHYAPWHYNPDYWRFTAQCLHDVILDKWRDKCILTMGDAQMPELVAGIATKHRDELPFAIDVRELNSMLLWSYPYPFVMWSPKGADG